MSQPEVLRGSAYRPKSPMPTGGRLVQAFAAVDLRLGHMGLTRLAAKHGLRVEVLNTGEYVAFFNARCNKLKILTCNDVIAYRRLPKGRFFDLSCINGIVRAFHNHGSIDYDSVLKNKLETLLGVKKDLPAAKAG